MEQVHNRRKAFIYVSNGYDFDPFSKSRAKEANERYSNMTGQKLRAISTGCDTTTAASLETQPVLEGRQRVRRGRSRLGAVGADARSQPRQHHDVHDRPARAGRRAGSRRDQARHDRLAGSHPRDAEQPARHRRADRRVTRSSTRTTSTRRSSGSTRETSDYYVLGYYSSNPDPLKKRRNIEIKVKKAGKYDLNYKTSYTLRPPPAIKSSTK